MVCRAHLIIHIAYEARPIVSMQVAGRSIVYQAYMYISHGTLVAANPRAAVSEELRLDHVKYGSELAKGALP